MKQKRKGKWFLVIIILIALGLLSWLIAGIVSLFVGTDAAVLSGNVAMIPIKGVIANGGSDFFGRDAVSSDDIAESIEKAGGNSEIRAIIFEIDSPGGSPVASEEIVRAIKNVNKTTVAWIRETGASGAYWVASATDYIVASSLSITGSVGVISSYIEFAGLIERYNMSYQRLVAGDYKDIGDPFKRMNADEKKVFQDKINRIHEYFISDVAKNRKLSKENAKEISTAMFYLGSEAKELGLVDEIGSKDEVVEFLKKRLNTTEIEIVEYKKEKTLWDVLANVMGQSSFHLGEGIGNAILNTRARSGIEITT